MSTKAALTTIVITLVMLMIVWYVSSMLVNWSANSNSTNSKNAPDSTQKISEDLMNVPQDSELNTEINVLNQDLQDF